MICGLPNIGNTCGINTIIQCLFSLDYIWCNYEIPETILWNKLKDIKDTCDPTSFIRTLIKKSNGILEHRAQHDITELWIVIYNIIEEELAHISYLDQYPIEVSVENAALHRFNPKGGSFWNDSFQGMIIKETKCKDCKYSCKNYEPFTILTVPLTKTLLESLDSFMAPETSIGSWCCDKCKKQDTAIRTTKIIRLPNILVIAILRATSLSTKSTDPIDSPKILLINSTLKYCLKSIGLHYGSSTNSGHYIAYNYPKKAIIDDDQIYDHDSSILKNNSNTYMLFYEFCGT